MGAEFYFLINIFNDFGKEQFLLFSKYCGYRISDYRTLSTIGAGFGAKTVEFEKGRFARLSLWVMSNQERFRFLIPNWLKNSSGILIMCDITREREIIEIDSWLKDILSYRENLGRKILIILVGYITNDKKPKIPYEELRNLAKSYKLDGCKICNLQTGYGIDTIFETLTRQLIFG